MSDSLYYHAIAKMIDHSLLDPTLTTRDLEAGCALAISYDVASVCILPYYLARCAELLGGTSVNASTTIGFPHGSQRTAIKAAEARQALKDGGRELDVVINISKARSGDWQYVNDELLALTQTVHAEGAKIKAICERTYLDDASMAFLCGICGAVGVDWIETSMGNVTGCSALDDLKLMRKNTPGRVQIKISDGIRDLDRLLAARAIGVGRVGLICPERILEECRNSLRMEHVGQTVNPWKADPISSDSGISQSPAQFTPFPDNERFLEL
jgi:deoxyribose-phosphate aldolase